MIDPSSMHMVAFDLFRTTFNTAFNAMTHFQEQNEKTYGNMLSMLFRQLECCREDSLGTYNEWVASVQDSRNEFKSAVDEGYKKMERIIKKASAASSS